jgi:hypothetical protein
MRCLFEAVDERVELASIELLPHLRHDATAGVRPSFILLLAFGYWHPNGPAPRRPSAPPARPRPSTSCSAGSTNSKNATATTSRAPIRDNLIARVAEAEREGWLGEVEGLQVSLAGAEEKLAQMERAATRTPIALGLPVVSAPRVPANSFRRARSVG